MGLGGPWGSLGGSSGILGAPGRPWGMLGGVEASIAVSATDRSVTYAREIVNYVVIFPRLQHLLADTGR